MKESKVYVCEICETEYNDKIQCLRCEENHKKPLEIKNAIYSSIKNNQFGYPETIVVKMSDGSEVVYRR